MFGGRVTRAICQVALVVCVVAVLAVLIAGQAGAADQGAATSKPAAGAAEQSPEQAAGGRENLMRLKKTCQGDVTRLCKSVRAGGGRILQCLREHESDLTADCRQAVNPGKSQP